MKKSKKKNTISRNKGGRPRTGHKVAGTDEVYHPVGNEDPLIIKEPKPKADPENAPAPNDVASKHKFPPPRNNPEFRKMWMQYIDDIAGRENFKVGHLNTLEILCGLLVDYKDLEAFIRVKGRSYQTHGRGGMLFKFYPEVAQLKSVQIQIRDYMKMLGLGLVKDASGESGGEKENWD